MALFLSVTYSVAVGLLFDSPWASRRCIRQPSSPPSNLDHRHMDWGRHLPCMGDPSHRVSFQSASIPGKSYTNRVDHPECGSFRYPTPVPRVIRVGNLAVDREETGQKRIVGVNAL